MTTTSMRHSFCNGYFVTPRTLSARAIFQCIFKLFDITKNKVRGNKAGKPCKTLFRILRYRPPRGGRGLKQTGDPEWWRMALSPPTRGARIETCFKAKPSLTLPSPPTRGARIETAIALPGCRANEIAPHAGGAD